MDTIVPSANAVFPSNDILKLMSTTVAKITDTIDFNSPPAHALELSYLEQANPRGYTRPMFLSLRAKISIKCELLKSSAEF